MLSFQNGCGTIKEKEATMLRADFVIGLLIVVLLVDISFNIRRLSKKLAEFVNKKS